MRHSRFRRSSARRLHDCLQFLHDAVLFLTSFIQDIGEEYGIRGLIFKLAPERLEFIASLRGLFIASGEFVLQDGFARMLPALHSEFLPQFVYAFLQATDLNSLGVPLEQRQGPRRVGAGIASDNFKA